ncbi:Phytochrome-like protein cph2 [Bacillus sp. THAF10]|uniref:EAL domain-containing protein n=1 Tax=Bacillus sp. THAF10 TaxID=2587848 RepID=UPI001268CB91|nr:EAL domain-containing protein [Bacillus sp. THAF10]QFT90720.1 Phytochrome-like protein cph2 [Bacillus sp. THAF10]
MKTINGWSGNSKEEEGSNETHLHQEELFHQLKKELSQKEEELKNMSESLERQIMHQANHDYLTGLPNRKLLKESMEKLMESDEKNPDEFAVLSINLDRFKHTNDTLGHGVGDALLQEAATRLQQLEHEHSHSFVFRVGGDEFILLFQAQNVLERVKELAKDVMDSLKKPFHINNHELFITACVGVSLYPNDGESVDMLLKHADVALSRAKELGKNYLEIYTPSISVQSYQEYTLERDMHKAIKEEQFEVYFQAKVLASSYKIVGAEALIRWNHPIWGMISPVEFIPLAEEYGMINEIGDYVMEKVLKQLSTWKRQALPLVPISINVAPQRFLRKNYSNMVKRIIEHYEVSPSLLELEITESTFLQQSEDVLKMVQDLREFGVKVALDDFGTGYSSMTRLTELDIDVLKVDKSFVKDVEVNRKNAVILESLIVIAKELKMELVVEGVETIGQLQFMKEKNCDIIQGFIFSRPVPVSEFTELLEIGSLEPKSLEEKKSLEDQRQYFRMELPQPIRGDITIRKIKDKEVSLGRTGIVIDNIGPGGLRFLSHIQFPVREDVILSIEFKLLGEHKSLNGRIFWKTDVKECFFGYGLAFLLDDKERAEVTKLLNHTAIHLSGNKILPDSQVLDEPVEAFLNRMK